MNQDTVDLIEDKILNLKCDEIKAKMEHAHFSRINNFKYFLQQNIIRVFNI